jgi:uncharacterized membrane protein
LFADSSIPARVLQSAVIDLLMAVALCFAGKEKAMSYDREVLYCGDGTLESGASYLGGIMAVAGIAFDYVPMNAIFPEALLEQDYALIILSDYPSGNFPPGLMERIARKVEQGTSLLMVGGWESFHGLIGNYQDTTLASVLPVECLAGDDRLNWCHGLVPQIVSPHPILKGLPWDKPPIVCGCNRVTAKREATTVMALRKIQIQKDTLTLEEESLPLLVVGTYGKGRTGAVTTDFAPHWAGGLVDWGGERVSAQAPGGRKIEVGSCYAAFLRNILLYFLKML